MTGWIGIGGILFFLATASRGLFPRLGRALLSGLVGIGLLMVAARWAPAGSLQLGVSPVTVGTIAVLGLPGLVFLEAVHLLLH